MADATPAPNPAVPTPEQPLRGVVVLDLATVLSGPLATVLLADQGADVIKVERPGAGDLTRSVGSRRNGVSAMFQLANRGKRSIALNIAHPEGRRVIERLAPVVDVVVENFRPGVAQRLGLGYGQLSAINPQLVYASIAGFGFEGELAEMKVYDNLIQAVSGLAAQQTDADGRPQLVRNLMCDKITALYTAQAISAALYARSLGAGGQHIQLAMLDAAISFLWTDAGTEHLFVGDGVEWAQSGAGSSLMPHRDGFSTSAPVTDEEFATMCKVFGHPELAEDPQVATMFERLRHPDRAREAREALMANARHMSAADAVGGLVTGGVPAAEVVPVVEVPNHPQVLANETFVASVHPQGGEIREPRPPARLNGHRATPGAHAVPLGANTSEILEMAGYEAADIERLRADGVVT